MNEAESNHMAELRRRAEERQERQERQDADVPALSPEATGKLIHELSTHQIELELQNEELRRAQEALVESRDRYSDLYDFAPLGYVTTAEQGKIAEANLTLAKLLGVDRATLLQRRLSVWVVPEDQDTYHRHRREALASSLNCTCQLRLERADAEPFWAQLDSLRLEGRAGHSPRLRTIVADITDRKEQERMNLDLERQMQHSQKLESLGVMAGGIAHDFNNILTVIIANAELCLQHVAPDCPARESVEDILSAGDRAAAIARQMLDYSGHGAFILKPIDANQLIRDMKHLLSVSVPKNASISERLSPAVPTFDGSETQIRQVVMNLIINAAESLGDRPGSVVLVSGAETYSSARLADCVNPDAPHALPAGDYVFIEVIDNGCGMSAETIVKIFDPFFTTKFTGRGLGMSAVLGIMRGHHGAIEIESNPGQGTRFRVLFPVSELQPGSSSSPGTAIATDDWQGHGTILMVDDEKPILTIGRRMLEHLGFKVIPATNGRQALDAFRQHAGEISAVLLDLSMPELGGEEVFREMNRLHPEIPVILTSGFGEQAATRSFAGKGLAGFLSKPFTVAELKSRLRKATAGLPR